MNEKILMRHVLEGLIHNLNNPLNLILGYSHNMLKANPESVEAEKIYHAGIRMDDILKELYNRIAERSFDSIQEISPASWLSHELDYLQNYLPIKHGIRFVREDLCNDTAVLISLIELATWYETRLECLRAMFENLSLRTGICNHGSSVALYIKPEPILNPEQAENLGAEFETELCAESPRRIKNLWMPEQSMLLGIFA